MFMAGWSLAEEGRVEEEAGGGLYVRDTVC